MMNSIDAHVIAFVDEWGDKLFPQFFDRSFVDTTEVFSKTKKCRMIQEALKEGKHIYTLGFKGCRGMIQKWEKDARGRMVRDRGKGVVAINSTVAALVPVDINVPFITSDEVLMVDCLTDRPYNLEPALVEESMIQAGFDPVTDLTFIFFVPPEDIDFVLQRFLDEMRFIVSKQYLKAKGIIALQDPKWIRYHASEKAADYGEHFFFSGVNLLYSSREAGKRKLGI